jgi:hypothetical protein
MTDVNALFSALRIEQDGLERDDLLNALEYWVEQMRRELRIADDLADKAAKAIAPEFALSPSDGGGVDTHHAIKDMAAEIERLRAALEAVAPAIRAAAMEEAAKIVDALFSHANGPMHVYEADVAAAIRAAKETA